jgi:valyl-tRNA synthetase
MDAAFDPQNPAEIKVGRRLAVKILNASRFALGTGVTASVQEVTNPLDKALLTELAGVVRDATKAYEDYNYAAALERTETFFWALCDDYLELVKSRAYGERGDAESARSTLSIALSTVLRLFAPVLPFVTDEVWSWWQDGSIHRAAWPAAEQIPAGSDSTALTAAAGAISAVRKAKSDAKLSMRADVATLTITGPQASLELLRSVADDVKAAGRVGSVEFADGAELSYEVAL